MGSGPLLALLAIGWPGPLSAQQAVPLTAGMVIDRSITIQPGTYRLSAPGGGETPAVTVRGSNITIDFNGAVLAGGAPDADPDTFAGVGLLIDGGSRITVKNAVIRGYKVGILARKSADLHLTRNDLSYNWKQRLHSGLEKESLVDWMSYHQNEKDEWLRFGAAIYLSDSDRAEIDHNTVVQGQNGLMVTRSTGLKIWNNTIQFMSSLGIGFYRVTHSTVMHNRIDWCVRGYSHGFYNRGQDSAGLLMYEQSSNNTVAFNSITHGGDGLFLWAGQSTMDTGQGGSNDNFFFGNDFSHAPTNGIEATFSRNRFHENRIEECWHGVWGGYSFDSEWVANRFARNTEAIAIEHGQSNTIAANTFSGDEIGIRLWQNASQDPDWGYPKNRDTRSRGYTIAHNAFQNVKTALQIRETADVRALSNTFDAVGASLTLAGKTPNVVIDPPGTMALAGDDRPRVARLPGGIDPMIKDGQRRGRETIIVDEWGPYDWKSPKLWPVLDQPGLKGPAYARARRLRVLGPEGRWKVVSVRGASVSPQSGNTGAELAVTPPATGPVDYQVTLEYTGAAVTSPRGAVTPEGQPYRFSYSSFFVPIDWRVRFFEYTDAADPVKQPEAFAKLVAGLPLKEVRTDRLDYISGRSLEEGLPRDRFAFEADGTAELPPGAYVLTVISDDGAKVWMDGEVLIDEWAPHESRVKAVEIPGGKRRFKVQYYEVGGFAELRFHIQRK